MQLCDSIHVTCDGGVTVCDFFFINNLLHEVQEQIMVATL